METCSICLDSLDGGVAALACGHRFHAACLASMAGRRLGILYEHAWSKEAVAVNDRDRTNIVFELLRADYYS